MRKGSLTTLAVALASVSASNALAETSDDRMAQLEARIQGLEAELRQYRNAPQPDAATVDKVLADAKARSALVPGGGKVGYSNGYFLADEKNDFQLKLTGLLQTRFIYNHNDSNTDDNDESGFQIRRAELYVSGNAFNPKLFYQLSGGFDRGSGTFSVVSAYAGYQFDKTLEIRAGLFKAPFMIEELTSAARQQAVERSFVNTFFTVGTTEGVQGQYVKDPFRVAAMVHDGSGALSTEFSSDRTDFALAARVEWKLAGEWSQFADFAGWDKGGFAARLGAAVDYEHGETGDSAANPDVLKYTVDLTVKDRGWGVFLAAVGKHQEDDTGPSGDLDQYGLLAQGGVFVVPNRVEVFGRYEHVYLDGWFSSTTQAIDNEVNLATVGVNWFFLGHNAKITSDVVYVFDAIPAGSTGLGLLPSQDGAQVVFRTGFYLMF